MRNLGRALRAMFLLSLVVTAAVSVRAEAWTNKPVRIVVPFSAGGSTDSIARRMASRLKATTGMSVVVENITGGGSAIGAQSVIRATPDGTSLLLTGNGTISVMKHVYGNLSINPERDLKAITAVNTLPHWIVVRADRPEKNFAEFVDHIRKSPGKVNISVNALGGTAHLALASWAKAQGLDFAVVPYRGSSAAMVDLLGGVTTAHIDVVGSSLPFVKSGKARALTLLQPEKIANLPEVPAESLGLQVDSWHVIATASGTPDATAERVYQSIAKVIGEPDFQKFIHELGFEVWNPSPEKTRQVLLKESDKYREMVRVTGIRVE